ncbi:hypothetical protein C3Z09_22215 [Lelliottia aquatilis]|uniref:hypothetical protein n=1 Tax=Lelliottia aquatilis TaxID=2080838 RepID=UPI000CDEACA1|nr:hypothetical protein [Lelliottia aquatilis]POZ13657.1 hypothetical protein C3Z09_22215 [Lelliottia aquatilis]
MAKHGGLRTCAAKFNFPNSSLGAWCRLERYPTPLSQQRLLECSENEIDFYALLQAFIAKRSAEGQMSTPDTRRLTGSVLVKNLARLKRVFQEMDLPAERCNLHGEKITARWAHTHVTVCEVRDAIGVLVASGKDSGDLQLIHKTIAESRNAALGRLNS